jgi:glycosyltransferase involved in cell wall biosynthesis
VRPSILCIIETVGKGGGAEQLIASLLPEMRRQGADVEVAALFDWPEDLGVQLEADKVPLHRLHIPRPLALPAALRNLRRLVRSGGYDVFWGHLYYGNLYARAARALVGRGALAITLHSEGYLHARPSDLTGRLAMAAERRLLAGAELKVAVSQAVRDDYAQCFGWHDIAIAHNGVDCRGLVRTAAALPAARAEFGYSDSDFLMVTPARYVVKKGQRVLLDALERLRHDHGFEPKLLMCGVGPLLESIRTEVIVRGLASQVTVSPVIPHERLLPLIAAADAVVLPSLREPFGIAAAEAMALGAACVLSDVDGFRELTAGADCALLVPPGDAESLAAAVLRLHSEPQLAAGLGAAARRHVCERFDIPACAARWIELLEATA